MEKVNEKYVAYYPFLEDLRRRLYKGVVLFAVTFFIGFFQTAVILKYIISNFDIKDVIIAATSPFQFTSLATDVGFFLAIIVSIPYFMYNVYAFIAPAITKKERSFIYLSIPICLLLFIIGFSYGFFILYYTLQLLANINTGIGIQNIWNVSDFVMQIFMTASFLGLFFEFPIIITLLIKSNMLKVKTLKNKRRIAYFLIFALTALLPPTDGISLIAIALPLIMLYEVTILFNNNNNKNNTKIC
jgi:sec-independent protein translocase protein TatC